MAADEETREACGEFIRWLCYSDDGTGLLSRAVDASGVRLTDEGRAFLRDSIALVEGQILEDYAE